jgi:glutamate/tyrosine decarboxylase-like PLP-dependent enzyme
LPPGSLPDRGLDPATLLDEVTALVIDHSALNGHPDFFAFITSSAAPIGALGDLLASTINPNLGGWPLSPVASEIERQTVQWIADFLGYPHRHGLMVSGGNMANLLAFWAARQSRAGWNIRARGTAAGPPMAVYVSRETHTWVQKAADLSGIGTDMIRWIDTDDRQRMEIGALNETIEQDVAAGIKPFLVVGTAGTVSTGAVDPLAAISTVCRTHDIWFHVDGAYGAPAAALVELASTFEGMAEADSIAVDPHKWFYTPLQAGCVLIKDMSALRDTFSYHPPYYPDVDHADDAPLMYYEYGLENSRGFRALKVWLAFRQIGRSGFVELIREDIALSQRLYDLVEAHPHFEAATHDLSITTFRYVPSGLAPDAEESAEYLDRLNSRMLDQLREAGVAYLSNAVIDGMFLMRACVVNFRTTNSEIDALPDKIAEVGRRLDRELRPSQ